MPKLTDQTLKKKTKIGEYTDAQTPGLTLVVRASTSASRPNALRRIWTYRFTLDGKRRKLGLSRFRLLDQRVGSAIHQGTRDARRMWRGPSVG